MSTKDVARILESVCEQIKTKILWIEFPKENDLKALFTPNLAHVGFVFVGKTVSVNLKNPTLREFFNEWVDRFLVKINRTDTSEILIDKFNNEIKGIILLGQREKKLTISSARGLYGELLLLNSIVEKNVIPQYKILDGWHRPAPANHDFDFAEYSIEVKTVSRSKTRVKITSEDQLMAIEQKKLMLKLYRIEHVEKSQLDSLGFLYNEIRDRLDPALINIFEMKCAEDTFCEYLGPEHMPLDYKFLVIEEALYIVDQTEFPRIKKGVLTPGISHVSYDLDISLIENFKINL
jgi:hypothetical protein